MYKIFILIVSMIALTDDDLHGQDILSSASGFSVQGAFSYSSWSSDSFFLSDLADSEPVGIGLKLGVGYGITEKISLHANFYSLSFQREFEWDTFNFTSQTLGARFTFGATLSKWRPNFEFGLARVVNTIGPVFFDTIDNLELRNSGLGIQLGGGVDYYINTNIAITAQANYLFGNFSDTTFSGVQFDPQEDVDYGILNINVGVRYFID